MTFVAAIKSAFANYANFKGRASRSEYWWFFLFTVLVNTPLEILSGPADDPNLLFTAISAVFNLAVLVPSLALACRRLHDGDRSGWWQLIALTIIGIIPLLYWLIKKGTDGPNRYGEDRLGANPAATES